MGRPGTFKPVRAAAPVPFLEDDCPPLDAFAAGDSSEVVTLFQRGRSGEINDFVNMPSTNLLYFCMMARLVILHVAF